MSNLLLRSVKVFQPESPYHLRECDISIKEGIIDKIGENLTPVRQDVVEAKGYWVSSGWMDFRANLCDPGEEHKEDLASGAAAARKGGFTALAVMGTTHPAMHGKTQVEYLMRKSSEFSVKMYPIGTVTMKGEGRELAELYDMFQSGAVAFSDNKNPISNSHLLMRAMLYANGFGRKIIQLPADPDLSHGGLMHEGTMSTSLGLKGIPAVAEDLMLMRDLALAGFYNCPLHAGGISSASSLQLIREAKKNGIRVTCDVHVSSLYFNDDSLHTFDTNLKVMPPLRSNADREALISGLYDGTIDVVCTDHSPQDKESKVREFETAAFGMTGLETFWPVLNTSCKGRSVEQLIPLFTINPRNILGIPVPEIREGEKADLTVFSETEPFLLKETEIVSKSVNNPFIGVPLTGRVLRSIC